MESPRNDTAVKIKRAMELIDMANSMDPNKVVVDGSPLPKELLFSQRRSEWLSRLEPEATAALRLAVRAQHVRRWEIPRDRFPMTRAGYHQWRTSLSRFHAETAGAVLREAAFDSKTVERVKALIRKENLKLDPETQLLEDIVCLVFLEHEFADFCKKHDESKVIGVVAKTLVKMSPGGQALALELPLTSEAKALLGKMSL